MTTRRWICILLLVCTAFVTTMAQPGQQPVGPAAKTDQRAEKQTSGVPAKEQESPMELSLAVWANIAQILATLGVMLGILAYFRQRKLEYEQGIITRYRECTSQILGYFKDCENFIHRDHVFDIAGIIPQEYTDHEYKRSIRFQTLLTHLEESNMLYEHPENHMQLISCKVWTKTLFIWMRNGDLQRAAIVNRGYVSPPYSRSTDLFMAIHRSYAAGDLAIPRPEETPEPKGKYTCDPRSKDYLGQMDHILVLERLAREYVAPMKFSRFTFFDPLRLLGRDLCFDDGSYMRKSENPVHYAILSYLLQGNADAFKDIPHPAFWKDVADKLREFIKATTGSDITHDFLYQLK